MEVSGTNANFLPKSDFIKPVTFIGEYIVAYQHFSVQSCMQVGLDHKSIFIIDD